MIRVLIAEDSPVAKELLTHVLSSDSGIQIIGVVSTGEEVINAVKLHKPDIVTMDVHMPVIDGLEATRIIMQTNPVPVIIVTGSSDMRELEMSFRAVQAGALAVLKKPHGIGHPEHERDAKEIIRMTKLMAEVKVVRRWARLADRHTRQPGRTIGEIVSHQAEIRVVAIGASTGGPPVIQKMLAELPGDFPVPVLIVQHMAAGFTPGFAEWLGQTSSLPVHIAINSSTIRPGHVYIAPDGVQMKVEKTGRLICKEYEPENGLCPSVSYLFRSVADVFGENAVGVLLTGMGKDGAAELLRMKNIGAVTIAQDEDSCAVFGMPGEAVKLNAATYILPAEAIATSLISIANRKRS
jgi:two-component system, chemotaxis family, protein-glutamate methylesterase/glutaminase